MGADVVYDALQPLGGIYQLVYVGVILVGLLKLGIDSQSILQGAGLEWDHARHPVNVAIAHAQRAANVPQRRLGAQCSKGDDLGHAVVAEAVYNVMEHLVPPVVLEVQVDIGHLLAFKVEEPLEDQPVFQRVHVGDAQAIEGHTGSGATPDSIFDTTAADEADDIPDHQEVVGEVGV